MPANYQGTTETFEGLKIRFIGVSSLRAESSFIDKRGYWISESKSEFKNFKSEYHSSGRRIQCGVFEHAGRSRAIAHTRDP